MPLQSGKSPSVVSSNIRELHSGKTYAHTAAKFGKQKANKQAIAIALSQARKSRAFGGAAASPAPMMPVPAAPAAGPAALPPMTAPTPTTPTAMPATPMAPAPLSSAPMAMPFGSGTGVAAPVVGAAPSAAPTPPIAVPTPNLTQPQPAPGAFGAGMTNTNRPWGLKTGGRAAGGAGSFNMAEAPHVGMTGPAAYPARAMMRNMTRGALLTSTPGRADAHRTFVPSGSYVIPADVVSGRGQGNTLNGAGVLQHMFGMSGPYGAAGAGPYGEKGGPYGAGMPKMGGGKGARSMMPKPPKIQTSILSASGGGKEGEDQSLGTPVPVNLSGGEIVVPPEHLIATFRRIFPGKNYTLKQIHAMMDKWVLDERQRHRKTLAKLPGPAKD